MPLPYRAMYCPVCKQKNEYYGRLVFANELPPTDDTIEAVAAGGGALSIPPTPMCPNHKGPVPLVNIPQKASRTGISS